MTRITWITDIHLNFLKEVPHKLEAFFHELRQTDADATLIGGDIGEAHNLTEYLEQVDDELLRPVYFVLGNHDFYFGSIRRVRGTITQLCQQRPRLHYLTVSDPVELAPGVGLVGHDGWADARIGDYEGSTVMMTDYRVIDELAGLNRATRWSMLNQLGDEAADHLRRVLPMALDQYSHVLLLTHVPPMKEACRYQGKISDDHWVPHFTCKAMGDAILQIMRKHPKQKLTVLCGHTHTTAEYQPLHNVVVLTGGAEYGRPQVQQVFEF